MAGATGMTGPAGIAGATGMNGAAGVDGASCLLSQCSDDTATLSCGGSSSIEIPCITPPPPTRLVFASSTGLDSDLEYKGVEGIEGAEALCSLDASNAGLTGNFRPWLSTSTQTAEQFVFENTLFNARFALTDGTTIADSKSELITGPLLNAIDRLANNEQVNSGNLFWSGTDVDGNHNRSCNDWGTRSVLAPATHGTLSRAGDLTSDWEFVLVPAGTGSCDNRYRVICIQR
jgi:hypothetical protein